MRRASARRYWQQAIPLLKKHGDNDSVELLRSIEEVGADTGITPRSI